MGKTLVDGDYPDVSQSGQHMVRLQHLDMNYDCLVDEKEESITFDGHVQFRQEGLSDGWYVSELVFTVYFLDSNRTVIGVEYMTLFPSNQSAGIGFPFKRKFKYNKDYKYVAYSYDVSAWFN